MNKGPTSLRLIGVILLVLLALSCSEKKRSEDESEGKKTDYRTDIWIADLDTRGGKLIVGEAHNITRRDGYDNQPRFLPDGSGLLYSSGIANEETDTDIFRYDFASGESQQITSTKEPEFSPHRVPGGLGFSVVRAEHDSTSRLWILDDQSDASEVIFPETVDVAYYTWIDPNRIAMMTEGKESMSLQIGYVNYGEVRPVADVEFGSRTLQLKPGTNQLTLIRKGEDDVRELVLLDLDDFEFTHLAHPKDKSWEFVWTNDGHLLMGQGTALYCYDGKGDGDGWSLVRDFGDTMPGPISRLAVSPDNDKLAIVVWEYSIHDLE